MNGSRGDRTMATPPPRAQRRQDDGGYGQNADMYNDQTPPPIPPARVARSQNQTTPNGKVVLEGYRKDILNGFEGDSPRFNPMNTTRPQSSMLLNVNDSIQVHLLVETALEDSKEFELLSEDEVDELKRQIKALEQRIEQTRQNLAIQSKYRDAAISMGKLYSPGKNQSGGEKRSRMSLLGMRNSNSDQIDQADHEREASEKKCQDLALELWNLEKRLMEPQKRLLQHTAGILQMTHKGPVKVNKQNAVLPNGIPGSPESMYTYNNARSSIGAISEVDLFDERSLYRTFDRLDGLGLGRDSLDIPRGNPEQLDTIVKTEKRLEDLNRRLRDVIINANPERNSNYGSPPKVTEDGKLISSHLDFLEQGIRAIDEEQGQSSNSKSSDEYESALMGLWDTIQTGEEDIRQRSLQSKLQRSNSGLAEDDEDANDEVLNSSIEPFSISAFTYKVQTLFKQANSLKDQKRVLQRQIKQQRELNSKDNGELQSRLEETEEALENAEAQANELQAQLLAATKELEESKHETTQRGLDKARKDDEESQAVKELEAKLAESDNQLAQLEEELQEMKDDREIGNAEMQSRLSDAQTKVNSLMAQLKAAEGAQKLVEEKEKEIEERNMDIARLTTEVTIARAELDGAYGSRAQRAAEVAANPVIQKEIDDLTTKNRAMSAELDELRKKTADGLSSDRAQQLQKELSETIEEYEVMTKASIEWEKERETLEKEIDKLRDDRENLEAKLSDEQVRWLGMKSPGGPNNDSGVGAGNTSTTVLKNEFKKMMRDTRAENAKALRAEQAERRKVEEELRALKKAQGPGKSSLSQSVGP